MQIVDAIIEADWALSLDDSTPAAIANAAMAIDRGQILAIGSANEVLANFQGREHCSRPQGVLLPGFVNGHAESSFAQRGTHRSPRALPASEVVFALTQIAFAEYLRAGITCVAEWSRDPDAAIRAAGATRMRTIVQLPITDVPTQASRHAREALASAERVWDELRAHPLISASFAVAPIDHLTSSMLADVRRIADQVDAPVSAAWLGSMSESQDCVARRGKRPLRWLADAGLLRHGFTAAQSGPLKREELELLARTGGSLVYMPQVAMRHGITGFDLRALRDSGVALGLGTGRLDWLGTPDPLVEARLAHLLAEQAGAATSARESLQRASLGAARARGIDHQTGSLRPGKAADCIVLDLGATCIAAYDDLASAILFGTSSDHVTDVWVAGRQLLAQGKLTELDAAELRAEHLRLLELQALESAA